MAVVSIGMPVFNGEKTIEKAIESVLAQTYHAFALIISDNASTDTTESICRAHASSDPRIRYIRQPHNLGAEANFRYVLNEAQSEYFMWAAADDVRSPDFLSLNLDFLEQHSDFVASTSPVKFEGGEFDMTRMGDRSLDDDRFDLRLRNFLGCWHANGGIYSLMRTNAIKHCKTVDASFLGADWAIVLHLAQQGKLKRLEQGFVTLGTKGVSGTPAILRRFRTGPLDYLLPFRKMMLIAWQLSDGSPFTSRLAILWRCLAMNGLALRAQLRYELFKSSGPDT